MADSDIEGRFAERAPGQPTEWCPLAVLAGIPTVYFVGFVVWLLCSVQLTVVVGYSSVFAWGQFIAVLFLAPPTS